MKRRIKLVLMVICLPFLFLQKTEANISRDLLHFCTLNVEGSTFRIFTCAVPTDVKFTADRQFAISLTKGSSFSVKGPSEAKFIASSPVPRFQLLSLPGSYVMTSPEPAQFVLIESK